MSAENPSITLNATQARGGRHLVVALNGVGELHRDTIDLNSATSRTRFAGAVMRAAFKSPPDDWPGEVRGGLESELLRLAAVPPGSGEPSSDHDAPPPDQRIVELAKMPEEVRDEARKALENPKLIDLIVHAIQEIGVVGEKRLALTVYLTGVSAQLPKPLSVIIRGSSSSGKTYTLNRTSELFPPEVVLHATSLTTNALFYFAPGTLRHRWIVAGERSRIQDDDKAEATRALREMIESGRLTKAVPVKEQDQIVTRIIEQEGPIAFAETTTLNNIFDEDANRCLLLTTDEREEQTRRILDATAAAAAGRAQQEADRIRAVHHAINRMIPRCDVVVPFADHIAALYPTERVDSRRSFRHLLVLIKASALLHFAQRERDEAGNVIAALADYEVAEALARDPLVSATCGITEGARQFLAALKSKFLNIEFSTAEAQAIGQGSRRTKYNRISELNAIGAVEQTQPKRGQVPARWKLTGIDPATGEGVLPSVQAISSRLSGCTRAHNG